MGLFDITDSLLDRALSGATLQQTVLANNVANANTPGFKRSDVDFQSALTNALDVPSGSAQSSVQDVSFAPQTDTSSAMTADGNNVDIDSEMAKVSENSVDYQALISVAHARLAMLQSVIAGK